MKLGGRALGFERAVYKHLEKINAAINEFLDLKIVQAITSYHADYYSNIKEFIMRGGKRLRPVSLVNAYFGVGGKNDGDIYKASISVELLHNATLIHDDLIDHDETRRGKETFHVKYRNWYNENFEGGRGEDFGMTMAILGGNTLYNLGVEALLKAGFPAELTCMAIESYQRVFEELIEGVMFETILSMKEKASFDEYMQMIKMKTAALLESSIEIGAILGGGSEDQIRVLKEYSVLVGQAFQIQDDILGTFGEEEETGKPTDGDIKEGKKTVLVVYALEAAGPEELNVLRGTLGKRDATPSEVEKVRKVFLDTGALKRARETAIKLKDEAKEKIKGMKPPLAKEAEDYFLGLADFVVERIY